jgi:hypothetical protein
MQPSDTVNDDQLIETARAVLELRSMLASGEARAVREAAGIGQRAVARQLGLRSVASVHRYELGYDFPRTPVAVRYHNLLLRLRSLVEAVAA